MTWGTITSAASQKPRPGAISVGVKRCIAFLTGAWPTALNMGPKLTLTATQNRNWQRERNGRRNSVSPNFFKRVLIALIEIAVLAGAACLCR